MNRIFLIIGKSSSGKDSIYKKLFDEISITPLVTYTTRPMRENEQDGREYFFVDRPRFEQMTADGSVIEKRIYNTVHGEWIYFTSAECVDLDSQSYLGIGTLESYVKIRDYFGAEKVEPIYIEVEDGIRLTRALERERIEPSPRYAEMCRRFLADSEDFSEEKIAGAGITKRFCNDGEPDICFNEVKEHILSRLDRGECV